MNITEEYPLPWTFVVVKNVNFPQANYATVFAHNKACVLELRGEESEALAQFIVDAVNNRRHQPPPRVSEMPVGP